MTKLASDIEMRDLFQLHKLEALIVEDKKLFFTLASYVLTLLIYVNLSTFQSSVVGLTASILYFLINSIFLEHAFFEKEAVFLRLMLGILLLTMLLGFISWLALIIYTLDVGTFTLVLFAVATLSSLLNRRVKSKNAT